MSKLKAYILCRFADKSRLYTSWMNDCPYDSIVVDQYAGQWSIPDDAGIVITHMHYRWEEINRLREIFESDRVPVLILADGVLEYRNTWEHPELADGAIFQPVIGHKLACIGRGQIRIIESWGNPGKCELVGLPRLDSVQPETNPVRKDGPFRLLIATANTPAFNHEQRLAVIDSLKHIKNRIDANSKVNGRETEITWRLTDGLENDLDVPIDGDPENRPPLEDVIDSSDAVITTPSTLYLESLLRKRPTAILDFHNSPQYVNSSWTINAPKHLNWTLRELADPPAPKMAFQEHVLHDQLQCRTPARPRLLQLITTMVEAGVVARQSRQPIELPARILTDDTHGFAPVSGSFDPVTLYPDNEVFSNREVALLQAELSHAVKRLDTLPLELSEKNDFIARTIEALDQARQRAAKMQANAHDSHERFKQVRDRNQKLRNIITKKLPEEAAALGLPAAEENSGNP